MPIQLFITSLQIAIRSRKKPRYSSLSNITNLITIIDRDIAKLRILVRRRHGVIEAVV